MGRYLILLIAPVIIGVLIAAGVVIINGFRQRSIDNGLRQRRMEARRMLLEARRQDRARPAANSDATEQPPDLTHRRIAS
jgi:type II secretory pathway pseudopilin PulG